MAYPPFLAKLLIRSRLARWIPAVSRLTDGAGPFLHYYSNRVLGAPRERLRALAEFNVPLGHDSIDLGSGSPDFDITPSASTKLPVNQRGWPPPWGDPDLRHALARHLADEMNIEASPRDGILVTAGASAALGAILQTFTNAGDAIVIEDPCSPLFEFAARWRGLRIRRLRTWMEDGQTRFRPKSLQKAMRGAKLVVLASPNNPTGGVLAIEQLDQISWWAQRRDVLVVGDATFARFSYDGDVLRLSGMPRLAKRTLTIGSMSKGHALTSARIGWIAGHRHLVRPCALAANLPAPAVSMISQHAATVALAEGSGPFARIQEEYRNRRRYLHERLADAQFAAAWPAGGFFLWISTAMLGMTGRQFSQELLAAKRVRVWPGELFGPAGGDCIRLTYAGDAGRVGEGVSRLCEFIHERRGATGTCSRAA